MLFGLIDCNNFFVSCEKVFRPHLDKKPVVVLSSNDGCVISRSQEAKDIGIPMGAVSFEYTKCFRKYGVEVCSSNFELYVDMSRRVIEVISMFFSEYEIYSIDEVFVTFCENENVEALCKEIRQVVLQWTGIPVSIGISSTKTLAKLAGDSAKKKANGVFFLKKHDFAAHLAKTSVEDIWGIGRRFGERLRKRHIYTAQDFVQADDGLIKKELTVVGLRIALELRGISCLSLIEIQDVKKSISSCKSFEDPIFSEHELAKILAGYTANVAEKLREQKSMASYISVSLATSFFGEGPKYSNVAFYTFGEPTCYTPKLLQQAKIALYRIYKNGFAYRRVGILLGGLVDETIFQQDCFEISCDIQRQKERSLMHLVDGLNIHFGRSVIRFASEGKRKVKREYCSCRYTTRWEELPMVFADLKMLKT